MTPAINGRHQNRIAKPVEGKRARKRNDMAAIDEAAAEAALAFAILIEMYLRRVLVKARRHHMFGFLDGDAIHMVDLFAHFIIIPKPGRTGSGRIEFPEGSA